MVRSRELSEFKLTDCNKSRNFHGQPIEVGVAHRTRSEAPRHVCSALAQQQQDLVQNPAAPGIVLNKNILNLHYLFDKNNDTLTECFPDN